MVRSKFERIRPHVNIGTIGHLGHGKTTLTAAITYALAAEGKAQVRTTDDLDAAPEEKTRGMTVHTTSIEYNTDNRHYAHIDCPGHGDYIENMMTGAVQMDGAILVISAVDGIMPQTVEHIRLATQMGVFNLCVFLNMEEMMDDEEILDILEVDIASLLESFDFDPSNVPIIRGSALEALKALETKPDISRGDNRWVDKIHELMRDVDACIPTPEREVDKPFLMSIKDVSATERGPLVSGRIERGGVRVSEAVEIIGLGETMSTTVTDVETFQQILDDGIAGDFVSLTLQGVQEDNLKPGMVLAKPYSITPYTCFEAEMYVLTADEGGRDRPLPTGYRPRFHLGAAGLTGSCSAYIDDWDGSVDVAAPGKHIKMTVTLDESIAIEQGMRFVIREENCTVGTGIITKIIK